MIQWEDLYERICRELVIDCKSDYTSTKVLSAMAIHQVTFIKRINSFRNGNFIIYGPAGKIIERKEKGVVSVVADSAIDRFKNFVPDIIVTDLDGNLERIMSCWKDGTVLCIHAHGDNIKRIMESVPALEGDFLGTCQSSKTENLLNLHGFTDGDRAVKLAQFLEAQTIRLDGFDFRTPVSKYGSRDKEKKLRFAEMIILDSARERNGKEFNFIPEVF